MPFTQCEIVYQKQRLFTFYLLITNNTQIESNQTRLEAKVVELHHEA